MAITVSSSGIRPLKGAHVRRYNLALAVIAGLAASINNVGKLVKADKAAVDTAHGRGIVLSNGAGSTSFNAGERVDLVYTGPVSGFAGLIPGKPVYIGDQGQLVQPAPVAGFVCEIGYAEAEDVLFVCPRVSLPTAA